jgi:hypothetical protein
MVTGAPDAGALPARDSEAPELTLDEIEEAWTGRGYHAFSSDGPLCMAVNSAGQVLAAPTLALLDQQLRGDWEELQ